LCPAFDIAYSNNPLVIRLFEEYGIEARSTPLFNRENLEGTSIRHQMVEGDAWREHVPAAAETVIDEIDGVERLRQISETDTNGV
jgi:nicotinamide-nucleotide adenylyltransferase